MDWIIGEYHISNDKSLISLETVYKFMLSSYWGNKRSLEKIKSSIDNSICYGAYHDGKQVGFARVISDMSTVYYICDVYIDENYRGKGVGKVLIETILNSEEFKGLNGILGTRDAHGFYEKFGFKKEPIRFMQKKVD